MEYYFENESQTVISENDIKEAYKLFASEYDSYSDYKKACMWYNNGSLTPLQSKIASVKRELAIKTDTEDIAETELFLNYLMSYERR